MFIQQSTEYVQQIEAEIERLQQLRYQVRATIQSEEQLETEEPEQAPRKRAVKKSAGKKDAGKKVAAKRLGRPRADASAA